MPRQGDQTAPRRVDPTSDPDAPVKVLHITGEGRSGSTLLGILLGQRSGWFTAGEVRYLWQRGLVERRLCGCGLPVPECPVWSEVLTEIGGVDDVAIRNTLKDLHRLSRPSVIARAVRTGASSRRAQLGALSDTLTDLFSSLREVARCNVIVDTSKPPTYGWLLDTLPSVEVWTVHLVRDPRAVAFSWQRHKPADDHPHGGFMARKSAAATAVHWSVWNFVAERRGRHRPNRYLRLRYEDLVVDPALAIQRIAEFIGEAADGALPSADHGTELGSNHAVAGNPSRFDRGPVSIELDAQWRKELTRRDRRIVALLCAPLATHYGYRLRTGYGPDRAVP